MKKTWSNCFELAATVNAFIPDPTRVLVPINTNEAGAVSAAGTRILKKGAGGDQDISEWAAIRIVPTVNLACYFNTDTTKTRTLFGGQENIILLHPSITQVVVLGLDARVEIEGM